MWGLLAISLAVAGTAQSQNGARDLQAEYAPTIQAVMGELRGGNPAKAIAKLDPVIAAYEAAYKDESRTIFCAMSGAQALAYMAMAASANDKGVGGKGAVAVVSGYCDALYLKGFALIDLDRIPEARSYYERVLALAPMHSQYHTELGQSYQRDKDWEKMFSHCAQAESYAGLAENREINTQKGMAWRCMGFAKIEMGEWDAAAKLFKQCLKLNPGDTKAKNELQYIKDKRPKKG